MKVNWRHLLIKKSWNYSLLDDLPKRNTRESSLCWKGMTSDCNINPTVCLFKAIFITPYCWAYIDVIYVTIKAHRKVEDVKNFLLTVWFFGYSTPSLLLWALSSWGNGSYSSLQCIGFSLQWLLSLWSMGSGMLARTLVVAAHSLVAPRHVGSSQTKNRTHVSWNGSQIPNHWTTREVPRHEVLLEQSCFFFLSEVRINIIDHDKLKMHFIITHTTFLSKKS